MNGITIKYIVSDITEIRKLLKRFEWSKPSQLIWHRLNDIERALTRCKPEPDPDMPEPKIVLLRDPKPEDMPSVDLLGRLQGMEKFH